VAVAGDVAGELAAVGALGFELGFGSFGSCSFGAGEGALCLELGVVAVAEGFALAGGVVAGAAGLVAGVGLGLAGAGGFRFSGGAGVAGGGECVVAVALEARRVVAGGGDLLACCFRGCADLLGGVAAELVQPGGQSAGGFLLALGVVAGRGGIVAGGLEGLGECLGLGLGFCLASLGGDGGCLGAPPAGLGVGDVGADAGRIEGGGLVACGPGEDGGLAEGLLKGVERASVPAAGGGGDGEAGVVVVAAGAVIAAEHAVPAPAGAGRDGIAAAGSLALGRAGAGAGAGVRGLGHGGCLPFPFLF
jgi:hypothetical protein